jgi:hypothetical protein
VAVVLGTYYFFLGTGAKSRDAPLLAGKPVPLSVVRVALPETPSLTSNFKIRNQLGNQLPHSVGARIAEVVEGVLTGGGLPDWLVPWRNHSVDARGVLMNAWGFITHFSPFPRS